MLDTLLEASGDRHGVFVCNVVSLVTAGLGERARASARVSPGRTIAEAAKLASVLYACLWLTAGLVVLIERRGWHHESQVSFHVVGLLIVLLVWSRGRQRLAGVIGLACTVLLVVAYPPDVLLPVSLVQPILPACGFLIMAIAPARERPSTVRARRTGCCECDRRREYRRVRPVHRAGQCLDRRAGASCRAAAARDRGRDDLDGDRHRADRFRRHTACAIEAPGRHRSGRARGDRRPRTRDPSQSDLNGIHVRCGSSPCNDQLAATGASSGLWFSCRSRPC